MRDKFYEIERDLHNPYLPRDTNNINKLKCNLKPGTRIYWKFKEDLDDNDFPYSGILLGAEDVHITDDLEIDECIICMDNYPTEKEYPQYTYFALNRLLDNESLVEIVTMWD